jgi:hypothetical protein
VEWGRGIERNRGTTRGVEREREKGRIIERLNMIQVTLYTCINMPD